MLQTNLYFILLLTFWHCKWKSLIRHVNRVIIFSLEPAPRRCEICQRGIGSQSMTQIFVPQPCQLHLSSGPRRCGGAGVEERWSCQQREWQRSLSPLGVGVKPLGSALLLFSSLRRTSPDVIFSSCRPFGSVQLTQVHNSRQTSVTSPWSLPHGKH